MFDFKKFKSVTSENAEPLVFKDHPEPMTRRDLLRQGFISFSASTVLGGLFTGKALADCGMAAADYMPFLTFDCAGGAAFPGNFLVGKAGGPEDFLASYDRLGWDPKETGGLDKSFGLPMSAKMSGIRTGITTTASAEARANLRLGSFCHFAQDDTSSNLLSAVHLVIQTGAKGKTVSRGLGTRNSDSGGNSKAAQASGAAKPIYIASVNDVSNSVGFGTAFPFQDTTKDDIKAMLVANQTMNVDQAKKYDSPKGKVFQELIKCAGEENLKTLDSITGVDPRQVQNFQQIYGINANTQPNNINVVFATVAMNAITGNSGPGVLTIAGCDYHVGNSTVGDAKDLEIGQQIGRAVEAAHRLKRPLFFQLITDGGVSNRAGTRNWVSDAGDKCMTVIGYYDPNGPAKQRRLQVGNFTDGQGADRTTIIGATPYKVACAVFANYLKLNVKDEDFEKTFDKYVPRGTFKNKAELESVLIFG